jgi:hypothetical protein
MFKKKPHIYMFVLALLTLMLVVESSAKDDVRSQKKVTGDQVPLPVVVCTPEPASSRVKIDFTVQGDATGGEIRYLFNPPYTPFSGILPGTSGTIYVPILAVPYIRGQVYWKDGSSPNAPYWSTRIEQWGEEGCPTGYEDTWDYICENWWILFVGFMAVMSYRFFSGRAMDFQDYFDEFRGKK